jgi:hypothetical protein
MRPTEPVIIQQAPHLRVAGDQPPLVAYRGTNTVDRAEALQLAQPRRDLQRMRLLERQLCLGNHGDPIRSNQPCIGVFKQSYLYSVL